MAGGDLQALVHEFLRRDLADLAPAGLLGPRGKASSTATARVIARIVVMRAMA